MQRFTSLLRFGNVWEAAHDGLPASLCPPEIVLGLHVHPEFWGGSRQPDSHIAEIPALPFNTRDSVTRVIRRYAAAVETAMSPRYSRRTNAGCGGLCMRIRRLLVIVLIVNEDCVLAFKFERQTPVSADADSP